MKLETDPPATEEDDAAPPSNGSEPAAPEEESWLQCGIPEIDHYDISDLGHIRNPKGHILTPYTPGNKANSVPWVSLSGKAYRVDKLVLETFIGPPRNWRYGPRHLNGDLADCKLSNLEWEYGLGRKTPIQAPRGRKRTTPTATTTTETKPKTKRAKIPTLNLDSAEVKERVFLESGNITVMWNRAEAQVDVSQLPDSSPIISESDIPSLIRCLQHIVGG